MFWTVKLIQISLSPLYACSTKSLISSLLEAISEFPFLYLWISNQCLPDKWNEKKISIYCPMPLTLATNLRKKSLVKYCSLYHHDQSNGYSNNTTSTFDPVKPCWQNELKIKLN